MASLLAREKFLECKRSGSFGHDTYEFYLKRYYTSPKGSGYSVSEEDTSVEPSIYDVACSAEAICLHLKLNHDIYQTILWS